MLCDLPRLVVNVVCLFGGSGAVTMTHVALLTLNAIVFGFYTWLTFTALLWYPFIRCCLFGPVKAWMCNRHLITEYIVKRVNQR